MSFAGGCRVRAPDTLVARLERAAALGPAAGLIFLDREERETPTRWPEVYARAAAVAASMPKITAAKAWARRKAACE